MGAYFITNNAECLPDAVATMASKGLVRHRTYTCGETTVLGFDKMHVLGYENCHREGEDFILGFGTYAYAGTFAAPALPRILAEYREGRLPFGDVDGHFTFVVVLAGQLSVITDKTGVYHGFSAAEGGSFYLSSSLFAVAGSLGRLTVSRQECLEFLYTQTTFGGATIFENIRHLSGGTVYSGPGLGSRRRYHTPEDEAVDVSGYLGACREYFSSFSSDALSFACDLSGGYDTRTVAALVEHAGMEVAYNTNTNPMDRSDHEVALELARSVGKTCRLFEHDDPAVPHAELVDRALRELELCRDVFRSAQTPRLFAAKAEQFDVILGGYGGELLRDKYSRYRSLREMVTAAYIVPGIRLSGAARDLYLDTLEAKFGALLVELGETDIKRGVEKIYCLEKMRYWGGSRITAFNQYCYRVHPLLDDALARYSFRFTNEEKAKGALQRRIITAASPALARVRSSYLDKPMLYGEGSPTSSLKQLHYEKKRIEGYLKKAMAALGNTRQLSAVRGWLKGGLASGAKAPHPLAVYTPSGRLEGVTGIGIGAVYNNKIIGRYLTLEKTLERFEGTL